MMLKSSSLGICNSFFIKKKKKIIFPFDEKPDLQINIFQENKQTHIDFSAVEHGMGIMNTNGRIFLILQ